MLTRFSRILVVDDSPTSRKAVMRMLESLGYVNLDEASDGTAALVRLARFRYALIISDWLMEPMPGIELLMKIRRSDVWSQIPFIMMTSRSQKKFMEVARDAGATHYLAKPFDAAELGAKIDRLDTKIEKPSQISAFVSRPLLAGSSA